ncbi:MAG: hypothetical protein RLN70_04790, partial [Rhodospirillaceae bacterium]
EAEPDGVLIPILDEQGVTICLVIKQPYDPEVWAEQNAKLITTAPRLLKVAERTLVLLTDLGIDLDGEDEALIAGIRHDLDEVINEARARTGR